jgi:hypothetical protein
MFTDSVHIFHVKIPRLSNTSVCETNILSLLSTHMSLLTAHMISLPLGSLSLSLTSLPMSSFMRHVLIVLCSTSKTRHLPHPATRPQLQYRNCTLMLLQLTLSTNAHSPLFDLQPLPFILRNCSYLGFSQD